MWRTFCVLSRRTSGWTFTPAMLMGLALFSCAVAPAADPAPVDPQAEEKIEQLLDKAVTLDFQETPLAEVVAFLHDMTGANILLDRRGLNDAGIAADVPVSFKAKNVRLRSALDRILKSHSLTFAVRDEGLLVTTPEEAGARPVTRIHPIGDLLPAVADEEAAEHVALLKAAIQSIDRGAWDDAGGAFALNVYRRQLVVNASSEMHRQIRDLLALLRAAQPRDAKGTPLPLPVVLRTESPQERQVRTRLDQPAEIDFVETPLREAIAFLSDKHELNIVLDIKGLTDAGVADDTPVTLKLGKVSLRSLLTHLLREVRLAYHVQDDLLLVTSPETPLSIGVYPIGDLATLAPVAQQIHHDNGVPATGAEDLISTLTAQIAPTTWEELGGTGSVQAVCSPPVLIVRQTDAVQREVEHLLAELRKKAAAAPPAASKPVERVYVLMNLNLLLGQAGPDAKVDPMPTAPELAKLIQELVEPASWKEEGVYVKPITGRLIVRHHPAVQQRIEKLLSDLNVIAVAPGGGFFGGSSVPVVGNR